MTPIQIIATIFAIVVLIKLIVITTKPKLWMNISGALLGNYVLSTILYAVLAALVGYYVLLNISIIDVAAVMLFTSLLLGVGLAPYSNAILRLQKEILSIGVGHAWLAILLWAVIALWVLYALFG